MDQLTLIFDLVGSPKPHEVAHIRNSQAKKFLETMQDRVKVPQYVQEIVFDIVVCDNL